ncbi:hypothetical protein NQ318_015298 [Aromia moschata]|uniref:Uncharacterized protein n=1 Tax=Aromia moschata TaxID=1265417 RepID=A0AAV8XDW2_9CUCU|nr:hypothetical protein NQ318_015298 [Aromia moschata]
MADYVVEQQIYSMAFVLKSSGECRRSGKKKQMATEDWFGPLMKRKPQLSLRCAQPTSLSRATSFNERQLGTRDPTVQLTELTAQWGLNKLRRRGKGIILGKNGHRWSIEVPTRLGRPRRESIVLHLPGPKREAKYVRFPIESWN